MNQSGRPTPDRLRRSAPVSRGPGLRSRGAVVAGGLALASLLGPGIPQAHAQPAASRSEPSPNSTTLRLPVMPTSLTSTSCTKQSGTVMHTVPWAQQELGTAELGQFTQGQGVTVGVVDTGVSAHAAGLTGRVQGEGASTQDCVGHGTFIAGLIAASPQPGAAFSGLAPQARIVAARGTADSGTPDVQRVASGIRSAVDAGAKVVDVSAAFTAPDPRLAAAVRYAVTHDALVVAPAVSDSSRSAADDDATPANFWPAAYPGVLAVVDLDIDGRRNTSSVTAQRADLAAPGQGVTSIGPTGAGHFISSGPSVAAAFVAGAAALVRAYSPELSEAEVADRLRSTAYPADVPRVDPQGAITAVFGPRKPDSAVADIHLKPKSGGERSVALAWIVVVACLLAAGSLGGAGAVRRTALGRRAAVVTSPSGANEGTL